jgi:hypothetical protein
MQARKDLATDVPAPPDRVAAIPAECALPVLTFPALNRVLDGYAEAMEKDNAAGPWERGALVTAVAGAGVGLVMGSLLGGRPGVWIALAGLCAEIGGFALMAVLWLRREGREFRHPRAFHAEELERSFVLYRQLVGQLRSFSLEPRAERLRFIQDRRAVMYERLGLFTGGMERLGVLPVLLALYLQFKDWRWRDWAAFSQIDLVQGLLVWALLLAYAASWFLVHLRTRVQAYELVLAEANRQDPPASRT